MLHSQCKQNSTVYKWYFKKSFLIEEGREGHIHRYCSYLHLNFGEPDKIAKISLMKYDKNHRSDGISIEVPNVEHYIFLCEESIY